MALVQRLALTFFLTFSASPAFARNSTLLHTVAQTSGSVSKPHNQTKKIEAELATLTTKLRAELATLENRDKGTVPSALHSSRALADVYKAAAAEKKTALLKYANGAAKVAAEDTRILSATNKAAKDLEQVLNQEGEARLGAKVADLMGKAQSAEHKVVADSSHVLQVAREQVRDLDDAQSRVRAQNVEPDYLTLQPLKDETFSPDAAAAPAVDEDVEPKPLGHSGIRTPKGRRANLLAERAQNIEPDQLMVQPLEDETSSEVAAAPAAVAEDVEPKPEHHFGRRAPSGRRANLLVHNEQLKVRKEELKGLRFAARELRLAKKDHRLRKEVLQVGEEIQKGLETSSDREDAEVASEVRELFDQAGSILLRLRGHHQHTAQRAKRKILALAKQDRQLHEKEEDEEAKENEEKEEEADDAPSSLTEDQDEHSPEALLEERQEPDAENQEPVSLDTSMLQDTVTEEIMGADI